MTFFSVEFAILILGFFAAAVLFWRIPHLPRGANAPQDLRISVVIPARNEAATLPLLLEDLRRQTLRPIEIIVANDDSEDETERLAQSFGATVLSLHRKPAGWVGKSWACQQGAQAATGDLLVFLDADVRLAPDGLSRIAEAFAIHGAVSVQPYHVTHKGYEQFSLIFNLIQVGANGAALPKPIDLGLYGPVIALSRADYDAIGGHERVKASVVEDMALAAVLRRARIPFRLFVGDASVSFRMYPGGFRSLWQGFTKNLATGAAKTPAWLFLLIVLFIASCASAPLHLFLSLARGEPLVLLYAALYALWAAVLFCIGRRIGRYSPLAALFYPLPLTVFLLVFLHSAAIRLFRGKVKWKGRAIELER
ncbi:MAG: glycosyltransferase [Clostridiales bacterium]|nr:glycosyltransferase [Clostridiales bacterium]